MIIFGENKDDKGTQLENLTRSILSSMGYTKIVKNDVRSGGEEIDVRAEYEFQDVGGRQTFRLICECKAHREPIDMSDWLKFLGKVLSEEIRQNQPIYACFIALGGVNGNVEGHYDDIKGQKSSITLVNGEVLLKRVSDIYNLCNLETIVNSVRRFTQRQIRSVEIAYYDERVFWVIIFEKDIYTFLNANSELIERELTETLKDLAKSGLPAMTYIDLREEAEAHIRAIRARKAVLSELMLSNGLISYSTLLANNQDFSEAEIRHIIKVFVDQKTLTQSEDRTQLSLFDENTENFYGLLAEMYRFLLAGEMTIPVIRALGSSYHTKHMNEQMVAEIQKIQGNMPLSNEGVQKICLLIRWSPTALAWALHPDSMIVEHRKDENLKSTKFKKTSDEFCESYLLRKLFSFFKSDFQRTPLREQFHEVYGLREVETIERMIIKDSKGVVLEGDLYEGLSIGQLQEGYVGPDGSNWALMSAFKAMPEATIRIKNEPQNIGKPKVRQKSRGRKL